MGLIKGLRSLFENNIDENLNNKSSDDKNNNLIIGEDPYYVLRGHHLMTEPEKKEMFKYWVYDQKIMRKSEWERLGFQVRDFNPKEEGFSDENIWYYFRPISDELAEEWLTEKKNELNAYERKKTEKESSIITNENTIFEIEMRTDSINSTLEYIPRTIDIKDFLIEYEDVIKDLKYIIEYENHSNFSRYSQLSKRPSELYNYLKDKENFIIDRTQKTKTYIIKKVSDMKTDKGKLNSLKRFHDSLMQIKKEIKRQDTITKYTSIETEIKNLMKEYT